MGKIVQISDYMNKWQWGLAFCWQCRHEWMAVKHIDDHHNHLECPKCSVKDSKFLDGVELYHTLEEAMNRQLEAGLDQ